MAAPADWTPHDFVEHLEAFIEDQSRHARVTRIGLSRAGSELLRRSRRKKFESRGHRVMVVYDHRTGIRLPREPGKKRRKIDRGPDAAIVWHLRSGDHQLGFDVRLTFLHEDQRVWQLYSQLREDGQPVDDAWDVALAIAATP